MILLHQVHSLRPGAAAEFEEVTRDQLLPLVASDHHDRPRRRAGLGRVLYARA
jgi:hypothetical protein